MTERSEPPNSELETVGLSTSLRLEGSQAGSQLISHLSSSVRIITPTEPSFGPNIWLFFPDRGMKAQGFDRTKNAYYSPLQPYLAYWGIFWTAFFMLINGFTVFWDFNASDFLTSCSFCLSLLHPTSDFANSDINIPIFAGLYFGYKITKRTSIWKPEEMDFVTVRTSPQGFGIF